MACSGVPHPFFDLSIITIIVIKWFTIDKNAIFLVKFTFRIPVYY